ncbi:MAG TPA: hypothetical protein VFN88_00845 [Caulobacteraceae bacterium]|nr:hypothetical protein [Caulobacteraceae bacterium]
MDSQNSRGLILAAVGGLAMILIGGAVAFGIMHHDKPSAEPPPGSQAGLVIDVKQGSEVKRDPNQQYRCFKDGQYVGMATLEECAKKNGVVSGALDVGIDQTGALAAADQFGTTLSPLPPGVAANAPAARMSAINAPAIAPAPIPSNPPAAPAVTPQPIRGPSSTCQRYDRGWTSLGEMPLNTCLQLLYAGHCERPGGALYGRWGDQSLRLVPGRIEVSRDDRSFSTLVQQGPGCSIPQL